MKAALAKWTVGVMGSASNSHEDDARAIGVLLARLEVNLLTGGGRGVMRAVAQSFLERRRGAGISIGILPCEDESNRSTPKGGYPNEFVELSIHTHLPRSGEQGTDDLSRNHINILTCAAIIALPGGAGTTTELSLATRYGKPVIAYSSDLTLVNHFPASIPRTHSLEEVERFLRGCLGGTPPS